MITEEIYNNLKGHLQTLTSYADKELIARPNEWGTIKFEQAKADIESVLYLATTLSDLPIEHLPNNVAANISGRFPPVIELFKSIGEFSIGKQEIPKILETIYVTA